GAEVDTGALFAGRLVRAVPLDGDMTFLASPCESAPAIDAELARDQHDRAAAPASQPAAAAATGGAGDGGTHLTLDLLRKLAAERVELPLDAVTADTHPLDDLHLSSITVGQIVNDVTRALGRPPLEGMPNFATVCLGELAEMIDELGATAHVEEPAPRGEVPGVAPWVRPFAVRFVEVPRPRVDVAAGPESASWTVYASE